MTSKAQTDLVAKTAGSIFGTGLIGPGKPLLLMVSGGSDSVALLQLMHELCGGRDEPASQNTSDAQSKAISSNPLRVLHVNHMLRGAESEEDERFVVALCKELDISCTVKRVDVAAEAARSGEGLEQTGRRLRYELAESMLNGFTGVLGFDASDGSILTAHTANDRAETLLQRMIVGGGSGSLASIPQRNGRIVRPLLGCTREELRAWLTAHGVSIKGHFWREDASNLNTHYSRAFVRHEILPLLEKRNPRIIEGLNRTADVLADESTWLDEQASALLPLTSSSFAAPLPLVRRAVYLACNEAIAELAPQARITFEHVEGITRNGSARGFACQIPGGIEVRNVQGTLEFKKARPPKHDPRTASGSQNPNQLPE